MDELLEAQQDNRVGFYKRKYFFGNFSFLF
jgi:hypothetical protein